MQLAAQIRCGPSVMNRFTHILSTTTTTTTFSITDPNSSCSSDSPTITEKHRLGLGYGAVDSTRGPMADAFDIAKVHELSDLELAALIALVAQEHCIIDTEPDAIDELAQELQLVRPSNSLTRKAMSHATQVASKVLGLPHAVVNCSEHTTLDDFAHAILTVERTPSQSGSPVRTRQDSYFLHAPAPAFGSTNRSPESFSENKTIANVIIAKNLDEAPKQVQIQALELMRTGRIFTRTSVQHAPKRFLFIALLGGGEGPRLTKHLNDYMFISHFHDPEDGFPNLEDMYDDDDGDSISSVVKKSPTRETQKSLWPTISAAVRFPHSY